MTEIQAIYEYSTIQPEPGKAQYQLPTDKFCVQLSVESGNSDNRFQFVPSRATPDSAGMDVRADIAQLLVIEPGERKTVPLGFRAAFPPGYVALLFIRSGHALKYGLSLINSVGVIDADFRDIYSAILINHSDIPITISPGERIGQIVLLPCALLEVAIVPQLDKTQRGGGFGSTGT